MPIPEDATTAAAPKYFLLNFLSAGVGVGIDMMTSKLDNNAMKIMTVLMSFIVLM